MGDPQRLEELRRRVQKDPASLAFAQLAEECRRAGQHQEAVRVCRAGLAHHPDYLSARVTLGRALLALDHVDQAGAELAGVLRIAPENLAALRGLAEVHQRRGHVPEALAYYERALALAPHDHEIHAAIEVLKRAAYDAPTPAPALPAAAPHSQTPAADARDVHDPARRPAPPAPGPFSEPLPQHPTGPAPSPAPSRAPSVAATPGAHAESVRRLERWLAAIERRTVGGGAR